MQWIASNREIEAVDMMSCSGRQKREHEGSIDIAAFLRGLRDGERLSRGGELEGFLFR